MPWVSTRDTPGTHLNRPVSHTVGRISTCALFSNQVPIKFILSSSFLMIHYRVGRVDFEEWRVRLGRGNTMMATSMRICTHCGRQTSHKICPECDRETVPEHLIPTHCLDCGTLLTLPPHLRTLLGQCEDCADVNHTAVGLWAWDALLCDLI